MGEGGWRATEPWGELAARGEGSRGNGSQPALDHPQLPLSRQDDAQPSGPETPPAGICKDRGRTGVRGLPAHRYLILRGRGHTAVIEVIPLPGQLVLRVGGICQANRGHEQWPAESPGGPVGLR